MNIHRFVSASIGIPLPASPLADLAHLDGLRMQTGDDRLTRSVRTSQSVTGARPASVVSNARQAQLEQRHAERVRKQQLQVRRDSDR